ncbi:Glycopeptide antibiotics resistance protein [Gracilibacillus orientalis]|uniref:Glycopeptide antibiotics resistance protein n=1 Tax=Gracilibacillus orientalis TaxID=334253 RepID=A0A1I4IIH6_9BACI|nr:VanZ family protein [Gracilibacillus orientalis]SFL53823.1 Glycopeptide antibiotics resistance protein [Gracilibacillus orientalis]
MKVLVVNLKLKRIVIILFFVYLSLVFFVNFVSDSTYFILEGFRSGYTGVQHNILPFTTIVTYLFNFNSYKQDTWFYNTFGNILLFVPMGMLLPLLSTKLTRWFLTTVIIVLFSFTIETMQLITQLGVFDVDDILLNTLGGYFGYLIYVLFKDKGYIIKKLRDK